MGSNRLNALPIGRAFFAYEKDNNFTWRTMLHQRHVCLGLMKGDKMNGNAQKLIKYMDGASKRFIKQMDVFFVTLNKADKDYSPTTMYNDYSINESLFHWQSQSTTAADSPTGQRYIHHGERGSKVLLFVREFKTDRVTGSAGAYTFLGTASYVKHEGSRPMNITWHLDRPIPAKFLKKTNKLVVG